MSDIRQVIVVAISRNSVIGRDGAMPWRLSTDLKRFKALTSGKPVIMGRKTFQSIGKPLPGRPNFIVTRDRSFAPEDVTAVNSLQDAIAQASARARADGVDEICVIGGGEIYRQSMETADIMHVTHVETEVDGDTSFPAIDPVMWEAETELAVPAGVRDSFATRFVTYRRRRKPHRPIGPTPHAAILRRLRVGARQRQLSSKNQLFFQLCRPTSGGCVESDIADTYNEGNRCCRGEPGPDNVSRITRTMRF